MKITVLGLWHLGCVTAASCAQHYTVTGVDFDTANVNALQQGKAPVFEPGLDALIASGLQSGALAFTTDAATACANADVLWVCADTPVNEDDESDIAAVLNPLRECLAHLAQSAIVLISSQLPVGTCAALEAEFPGRRFACSPENLRLGKALEIFNKPDRIIVGTRDDADRPALRSLLAPFAEQPVFMRTESAEMVKHALNSFLAVSVTFINEIARVGEHFGADAREVSQGLKSDIRIGPRAYLGPGGPFAGGTLARDVVTLTKLARENGETIALIPAIKQSNDTHRQWALHRLQSAIGDLRGKRIAVLGLTYKPGTDTLRRSASVELCQALAAEGAEVHAFDPVVRQLPTELSSITLTPSASEALQGADAAVISTEWPEFREVAWADTVAAMRAPVFIDANRFLDAALKPLPGVRHFSVGRA